MASGESPTVLQTGGEDGISQNHPPVNGGVVILLRITGRDLPIEHKLLLLLQLQDALFNRVLDHKPHASVTPHGQMICRIRGGAV